MSKSILFTGILLEVIFSMSGKLYAGASVTANRVSAPVKIDGRLEEADWQKVQQADRFIALGTDKPAGFGTRAKVLFDDNNIYIGIQCVETNPAGIKTSKRQFENDIFQDDEVEVMLDAGTNGKEYAQLAVNASGSRFDGWRMSGGRELIYAWTGDWEAQVYIGKDFWSCEMRVPYAILRAGGATNAWKINVCRHKADPAEYSALADNGSFNEPNRFIRLNGLDVKLSPKASVRLQMDKPEIKIEYKNSRLAGVVYCHVKNLALENVKAKVVLESKDQEVAEALDQKAMEFKTGADCQVSLGSLELVPCDENHGVYQFKSGIKLLQVSIRDITGSPLYSALQFIPAPVKPISIYLNDPWKPSFEIRSGFAPSDTNDVKGFRIEIAGKGNDGKIITQQFWPLDQTSRVADFQKANIPAGEYLVRASIVGKEDALLAANELAFTRLTVIPKRFNNLVSQLFTGNYKFTKAEEKSIEFENPRPGWVLFVSSTELPESVQVALKSADDIDPPALALHTRSGVLESMRYMPAGVNRIKAISSGKASLSVEIRAIPELILSSYNYSPNSFHGMKFGPYDWNYLETNNILQNINCMIGPVNEEVGPAIKKWKEQGKKWFVCAGVPGMIGSSYSDITADEAFKIWSENKAFADPDTAGTYVDEFFSGAAPSKYRAWAEGIRRLRNDPKFKDKFVYPYVFPSGIEDNNYFNFCMDVIGNGNKVCFERYPDEESSEEEAAKVLDKNIKQSILEWEKAAPGCQRNMIFALGYLVMMSTETQSIYPSVDFKYFLDMQFNLLANDPAFQDWGGIQMYTSGYTDDETMRWSFALYRHYAIEGRTNMLSNKYGYKYLLTHIRNGDFDNSTQDWEVKPAAAGSLSVKAIKGFGKTLEGRMGGTDRGDNFLCMQRSFKAPNKISQEIRDLVPGQLYSLKMISGDYGEFLAGKSAKTNLAISISFENVEVLPEQSFVIAKTSHPGAELGPFNIIKKKNPYWFNYHWMIFRAKAPTARVVISDWMNEKEPGGPEGQELMFNFVEIQPYFADKPGGIGN